ncbi:MAG: hypothetical protein JWL86_2787 [Rhizobium sp.]|nr:hypothetical protein [Rhizobium sp.]
MPDNHKMPALVMGDIEVIGPDGNEGIPYDDAIIHIDGDEDSEIRVICPGALRLAPQIVKACNAHEALVLALLHAEQFIVNGTEYGFIRMPNVPDPALDTLPKIRAALALARSAEPRSPVTSADRATVEDK